VAVAISLPILGLGGWTMYSEFAQRESERLAFLELLQTHARLVAAPAREMLPVAPAAHGRDLFEGTCAACHKQDGTGIVGLGKDLTQSWFVAARSDDELRAFVTTGRPLNDPYNTTKVLMPPRGGHEELSDADLNDIIVYVRGLQDPRRLPPLGPSAAALAAAAPPTEEEKAKALAAAGGDAELAEYIAHGTKLFAGTCSACHGKDAKGLPGLGKDLVHSAFCKSLDDDALLAFVKRGRDPSDPANTTKVGMPPRGGNPALSDDDLLDVISYVRSLQKQAAAAP
jgi:disulfide bond formation protein DsbB